MKSVLLVDDDENLLDMLKEYLETRGYVCYTATNGEDALKTLNTNYIGIAVIDVRMPRMSGLKLLSTIKSIMREFPIILMTGFELSQREISSMQFKADAYVTKPFSMDYIVKMIETLRRK